MRGKRFRLKLYPSFLHFTHRLSQEIEEIYLPEEGMGFNCPNGNPNVFYTSEERYKGAIELEDVEVSEDDVEKLKGYLKYKDEIAKIVRKYLKED